MDPLSMRHSRPVSLDRREFLKEMVSERDLTKQLRREGNKLCRDHPNLFRPRSEVSDLSSHWFLHPRKNSGRSNRSQIPLGTPAPLSARQSRSQNLDDIDENRPMTARDAPRSPGSLGVSGPAARPSSSWTRTRGPMHNHVSAEEDDVASVTESTRPGTACSVNSRNTARAFPRPPPSASAKGISEWDVASSASAQMCILLEQQLDQERKQRRRVEAELENVRRIVTANQQVDFNELARLAGVDGPKFAVHQAQAAKIKARQCPTNRAPAAHASPQSPAQAFYHSPRHASSHSAITAAAAAAAAAHRAALTLDHQYDTARYENGAAPHGAGNLHHSARGPQGATASHLRLQPGPRARVGRHRLTVRPTGLRGQPAENGAAAHGRQGVGGIGVGVGNATGARGAVGLAVTGGQAVSQQTVPRMVVGPSSSSAPKPPRALNVNRPVQPF
eukprot:Rmarinus@m.15555